MQQIKVNGLRYNWLVYKTRNFKQIHGLNFDNNEIEVLEIKSPDYDFHIVIRVDTHQYLIAPEYCHEPGWLAITPDWPENYYLYLHSLTAILVLGTKFSKKYNINKLGIQLFINRPKARLISNHYVKDKNVAIENRHVEKLIQFFDSQRFKPYITNSSGDKILRKPFADEISEVFPS